MDNDPNAITTSLDNIKKNHSEERIHVHHVNQFVLDEKVDLILANILAKPLISLATTFANYLKPQGLCVLSGILKEQEEEVKNAYYNWFDFVETTSAQDWVRLTVIKKPC